MTVELHPYYKNSWALIIGINSYLHASQLEYACNDADSIASTLIDDIHFPEKNIVTLKNELASKDTILKAFDNFYHNTDIDDQVIFFFAGHGMTTNGLRGQIGYLIPVDGDPNDFSSLIRWDDLTRHSEQIPAKHILFIMDACYSGLALQRSTTPGTQRFISDMLQRYSRQVITAGKADETIADGGGPLGKNSIFSGHLIQGLKGDAADNQGVITANGLMSYVYEKVAKNPVSNQTPHYGHFFGDGDLILKSPDKKPMSDYLIKIVPEMPELIAQTPSLPNIKSYSTINGYSDPDSPNFGRNALSSRLGENRNGSISPAFSWLSLIAEPITNGTISIDLTKEYKRLKVFKPSNDEPFYNFKCPREVETTIDSIALLDRDYSNKKFLQRYLKVDIRGNIEYVDTYSVFAEYQEIRCFHYVQMVGFIWQFIFLIKQLYENYKYNDGIRLLINVVGTRDTILDDFSQGPGSDGKTKWRQPFERDFGRELYGLDFKCLNPNIQMDYLFFPKNMAFTESKELISGMVERFSLAYNHQSEPRCFSFKTDIFPWEQFLRHRD
jgi:hypothetical protein